MSQNKVKETPKFKNFNSLPPELRLKVWELALPGHNGLLQQWTTDGQEADEEEALRMITDHRDKIVNDIRSACHESEDAVLKNFDRWYGDGVILPKWPAWVNPATDALYIPFKMGVFEYAGVLEGTEEVGLRRLGPVKHLGLTIPYKKMASGELRMTGWYHLHAVVANKPPQKITFLYDWEPRLSSGEISRLMEKMVNDYKRHGPDDVKDNFDPDLFEKFEWSIKHSSTGWHLDSKPKVAESGTGTVAAVQI